MGVEKVGRPIHWSEGHMIDLGVGICVRYVANLVQDIVMATVQYKQDSTPKCASTYGLYNSRIVGILP